MAYFNKFPKAAYDFNREGVVNNIVDIFRQVRPLQNFVDDFSSYRYYEIQDGERPDIVSKKLYDNADYYWTFFIVNDFLHDGLSSWPMTQRDLDEYIKKEYAGYALETRPNIKRDTDGGIEEFENSLAGTVAGQNQGGFTPGTTVTLTRGGVTTATGKIRRKDLYLNQLIIQDVTGTPVSNGTGNIVENCSGFHTDPVTKAPIAVDVKIWKAWKYDEAPHHYYISGDGKDESTTDPFGNKIYGIEADVSSANFFSVTDDAAKNLILQEGSVAAPLYTSNRKYLNNLNQEKSRIRIIDPTFMPLFIEKFEQLIKQ